MNVGSVIAQLKFVVLFLCAMLMVFETSQAQIVINEIVASNSSGISDEDGDFPDWVEFYNPTDSAISLFGYGISDDPEDLFKFVFSDIEVPANDYYLVFASDKDRGNNADFNRSFWETIVREGDDTKYIIPTSTISNAWIQNSFDDSNWQNGTFGIGYSDGDDETVVPNGTISVFTRTTFTIDDLSLIDSVLFHISFDDGYVAYINGVEISRFNMSGIAPIAFDEFSTTFIDEAALVKGEELPAISINSYKDILVEGENTLAIQIHNSSSTSSDLSLIPFLSISRSKKPENSRGVASQITLDNNITTTHLNFKLSSGGESIWLTKPDSITLDSVSYPELLADESYGRGTDGNYYIYIFPTPLTANTTLGFNGRSIEPDLTQKGGVYSGPINLQLADPDLGNTIYFTTDGNDPTTRSQVFGSNSRNIFETTVFKFRAIEDGKLQSKVVTHTYLIATDHDLPIVSISTEPANLWSDTKGIYVRGTNGIDGNGSNGPANWNQDWEIPVFIEYFEIENTFGFRSNAGAKIFGGWSRSINPQKSLAIYFRGEYGNSELSYKLFESKEIDRFQAFVLRNSGNDFGFTHFRDGLMTTLVEKTEIDYQAFKPAVIYLNGEYWGIQNIREKVNEHFIESNNSGVSSNNIDLLETNSVVIHGDANNYSSLLSELGSTDMTNPEEYKTIEELIDIDNFMDYFAAQIYFANTDWPGNNIKYWRDKNEGGKWRWIMYDTDFGFGWATNPNHNTLEFALNPFGSGWPNPSWSTYIFRKMVESDIFVNKFVNRISDLMNTSFSAENVDQVIDSLSSNISKEMPKHFERWGGSIENWQDQIGVLNNFSANRRSSMENFLIDRFNITSPRSIRVNISNPDHGIVRVNRIEPESYPWVGRYFTGDAYTQNSITYSPVPVELTAVPKRGYKFVGWSGGSTSFDHKIMGTSRVTYTANFEKIEGTVSDIIINEFMYNSASENETGDWIEFYNSTESIINLSKWVIKDNDDTHIFEFPDGTEMSGNSYLVVSADLSAFNDQYDRVSPLIGELGFNLSGNSDQIRLYDDKRLLVDSLQYDDEDPWDINADGSGFSLELIGSDLDNSSPENWKAAIQQGGTPGMPNSILVSNEEKLFIPSKISLKQNYPNPFNPSTNISFELPEQSKINLSIFDMLGRKVLVLADGIRSSGVHTITWNAEQQSSGVYFYRLEVGEEVFTKRMLLIK